MTASARPEPLFSKAMRGELSAEAETTLPTKRGLFRCIVFRHADDWTKEQVTMVTGDIAGADTLLRAHSECSTSEVFGSLKCDRGSIGPRAPKHYCVRSRVLLYVQEQEAQPFSRAYLATKRTRMRHALPQPHRKRTDSMALTRLVAWVFSVVCVTACGGINATSAPSTAAGTTDQASLGAELYGAHCASCHGADGKGNPGTPAVVGSSALPLDAAPPSQARKAQFHTALDVLQFVQANMPPQQGGSLSQSEYDAILAFDLKANGVDLTGKQVNADSAASFVLHP
jgi:mono/diheme cytochrome c family protein